MSAPILQPRQSGVGFEPIRATWLPYSTQWIDEDDKSAVVQALFSDRLTQGPQVESFEREFADIVGASYAVSFANGTEALVAAHRAAGIGPGDRTVTTPMTFAATANAALLVGASPRFCDIDGSTGLMDPASLEKAMDDTVRAVLPVHYAGSCCDMDAIVRIARAQNALVIEDACHALGADYHGTSPGTLADMSVFSFHPVKPITTGEGGMVTTNNPRFAAALKALATHGIEKDEGCAAIGPWHYEMRRLSTNSRLSDLHAALGRTQLAKSGRFLQARRLLARRYDEILKNHPLFVPLAVPENTRSAYHLYPVLVRMDKMTCTKKELVEALHRMNIGVQVHYIPVHRHPYYRGLGYTDEGLERSVEFFEREISLPLFAKMTEKDQDDVIESLDRIAGIYARNGL